MAKPSINYFVNEMLMVITIKLMVKTPIPLPQTKSRKGHRPHYNSVYYYQIPSDIQINPGYLINQSFPKLSIQLWVNENR